MTELRGTLYYIAPEVLSGSYGLGADMWSIGVIAFMLLTGHMPFRRSDVSRGSDLRVVKDICEGRVNWSPCFHDLSQDAQQFLKALLVVDPGCRLSASQALAHPWIVGQGMADDVPVRPQAPRIRVSTADL